MDVGRVGWSPDYRQPERLPHVKVKQAPGRAFDCARCGDAVLNVVGNEPPHDWRWRDDGWICGVCARGETE